MQFHGIFIYLFGFTSLFAWTFLKFLARCVLHGTEGTWYHPGFGYPIPGFLGNRSPTINYPSFPLLCVTNSSFIPSSFTNLFQSNFDLSKVPILGALPEIVPIILLSPPGRFWACCFSWAFWNCLASFESFSTSLVTLKIK